MFLFAVFLSIPGHIIAAEKPVRICNDSGEWPPYFYFKRLPDGTKSEQLVGATVDSFKAIFEKIGLEYQFELLPWQRCLAMVDRFDKTGNFELISEAGTSTWRLEHFLKTSEPVYKRTDVFYYNQQRFPNGIQLKSIDDMEGYKICVPAGYSFDRYVEAGLDPELVDVSHKSDYFDVIRKISLGYCDILPANLSVVEGAVRIGRFKLPANVTYTLDQVLGKPFYYYYWIARTSPRAKQLQTSIDQAIRELKADGHWEAIYRKYLSQGSGL